MISEARQHLRDANVEQPVTTEKKTNNELSGVVIGAKSEDAIRNAEKIMKLRGAPYGCTVVILKLGSNKTICYNIPTKDAPDKEWFGVQRMLLGKEVGYEFFAGANMGKCRVESISW